MNKEFIILMITNLIITIILYMAIPIISVLIKDKFSTKKDLIQFLITNSLLVWTVLFFIYLLLGENKLPSVHPPFWYFLINYLLLRKNITNPNDKIIVVKKCSRKKFLLYYGTMWLIFIIIAVIEMIFSNYSYFNHDFYISFSAVVILLLEVICFILKIGRLRDANLSPWFLSLYLFGVLGKNFAIVVSLILLAILCLPSQNQEIPTTNLRKCEE